MRVKAKKIRVTGAEEDRYWYADKIGEIFEVIDESKSTYSVYYEDSSVIPYGIHKQDCEIVDDQDEVTALANGVCAAMKAGSYLEELMQPAQDNVNQPSHYQNASFETIEIIEEITKGYDDSYVGYCVGNALKYLARAPYKHGEPTEDLSKAAKYLAFAIDYLERGRAKQVGEE